jgi:hypothetical protein
MNRTATQRTKARLGEIVQRPMGVCLHVVLVPSEVRRDDGGGLRVGHSLRMCGGLGGLIGRLISTMPMPISIRLLAKCGSHNNVAPSSLHLPAALSDC